MENKNYIDVFKIIYKNKLMLLTFNIIEFSMDYFMKENFHVLEPYRKPLGKKGKGVVRYKIN